MSASRPLQQSDLIFPAAHSSIHTTVTELKRSNLSIKNRIHSIVKDAAFVDRISSRLELPLVANERCGSWYLRPEHKTGSAYFKSTDGHHAQWAFSLRRLNLQVLDIVANGRGCIIVDSTRRGKSMPDALSKTVPIWIAVMNRLLFPDLTLSPGLHTPREVVSESEHAQIASAIDGFVQDALRLSLDLANLRRTLGKPMRPIWVTPCTNLDTLDSLISTHAFWPIVLCTASGRPGSSSKVREEDPSYVQGAADDHESWAQGLDAITFWQNEETLLAAGDDELPGVIAKLLEQQLDKRTSQHRVRTLIHPTQNVFITDSVSTVAESSDIHLVVSCAPVADEKLDVQMAANRGRRHLHLNCGAGKLGSRQLRLELHKLDMLRTALEPDSRILVACSTGKDLAVGVALAILCIYFRPDGSLHINDAHLSSDVPNKVEVKRRLSWIMASMPDAAPSRATLQSVNAFLMS